MGLSDTELFDEVIDELIQTMLENIGDDEDFQKEAIRLTEGSMDFARGDHLRCDEHWKNLCGDAVKKIKQACRKAGL